jgi:hypothetical protein
LPLEGPFSESSKMSYWQIEAETIPAASFPDARIPTALADVIFSISRRFIWSESSKPFAGREKGRNDAALFSQKCGF